MKFPLFQCILLAFSFLVSFGTRLGANEQSDTLRTPAREINGLPWLSESENARHKVPHLSCPRTTIGKDYQAFKGHQLKSVLCLSKQPEWFNTIADRQGKPIATDFISQFIK